VAERAHRPADPDLIRIVEAALALRGWDGQRLRGGEAYFRCPIHTDESPSARWHPEKHTWFCDVCNEGGGARNLAMRLGLPVPRRADASGPRPRVVASFTYRDPAGVAVYRVDRIEPGFHGERKEYRPRRPGVEPGAWADYGTTKFGIRHILYRLDELPPPGSGATVFIHEGEKKVDLCRRWGLHATCNTGGAKKWSRAYSERLAGLDVVIVCDNDEAGRGHRDALGADLEGRAARVRVLTLPDLGTKGDIVDWHLAGGTPERFAALAQAAPDWTPPPDMTRREFEGTIAALEGRVAHLERENAALRGQNGRLHAQVRAVNDFLADEHLTPGEKLTGYAVAIEIAADPHRLHALDEVRTADAVVRVPDWALTRRNGLSRSTNSTNIGRFEEWGVIARTPKRTPDGKTERYIGLVDPDPDAPVVIGTLALLRKAKAANLPPEDERHGGKRTACPKCSGTGLRTMTYCPDCGWHELEPEVMSQDAPHQPTETAATTEGLAADPASRVMSQVATSVGEALAATATARRRQRQRSLVVHIPPPPPRHRCEGCGEYIVVGAACPACAPPAVPDDPWDGTDDEAAPAPRPLSAYVGKRVTTPAGPGLLHQAFIDRAAVALDSAPDRLHFCDPAGVQPIDDAPYPAGLAVAG